MNEHPNPLDLPRQLEQYGWTEAAASIWLHGTLRVTVHLKPTDLGIRDIAVLRADYFAQAAAALAKLGELGYVEAGDCDIEIRSHPISVDTGGRGQDWRGEATLRVDVLSAA